MRGSDPEHCQLLIPADWKVGVAQGCGADGRRLAPSENRFDHWRSQEVQADHPRDPGVVDLLLPGNGGDVDLAGLQLLPPSLALAQQLDEAGIGLALGDRPSIALDQLDGAAGSGQADR